MGTFVTVLIMIVSVVLVLVVLVQNSKGGGLSSQFSGSNQVMGVKKTSELIEKITWGLAISLLILCVTSSFLLTGTTTVAKDTELREKIENSATSKPLQNLPAAAAASADSSKK